MRIAFGAAKGLAFLHEEAERPVIYRDFKTSNILLDAVCDKALGKIKIHSLTLLVFLITFYCRSTTPNSPILDLPKMVPREIRLMFLPV